MATRTIWTKGGLKIASDVSDLPAPRPKQVFKLPDISTAGWPFVTLSLYEDPDIGPRAVVMQVDAVLPETSGTWMLVWTAGSVRQGAYPVTAGTRYQDGDMVQEVTYTVHLEHTAVDGRVTHYPDAEIVTPRNLRLPPPEELHDAVTAAAAIIAAASLDTKITNLERPALRNLRASLAASVTTAKAKADAMVPAVTHTALDTAWTTFTTNVDPILAATTDSTIVKATFDGWWSAVYSAITDLQGVMATQAATAAAYADALARSSHNLIKNGNSEDPSPTGFESVGVVSDANALSGTKIRRLDSGGGGLYFADINVTPGEQFLFSLWIWNANVENAVAYLYILFLDAAGSVIWAGSPQASTGALSGGGYVSRSVSGTAPAGAVRAKFHINADAGNGWFRVDGIYACRKTSAAMLEADLAIVGVIRSPNYMAGSYGDAPEGFKVSGYAFTTTFTDGSTDSNCYMEIGGSANFGGRKVSTIVNRTIGGIDEWTTAGTRSWTCPEGITEVEVTLQGPGGNGYSGYGGGGGAGLYIKKMVTVTPGTSYSIVVGAVGSPTTGFGLSATQGANGTATTGGNGGGTGATSGGGSGVSGGSIPYITEHPESGWYAPGAGGGGPFNGTTKGNGGSNGPISGGLGGGIVSPAKAGGGGGGASAMAAGGAGGTADNNGTAGVRGSGGGGGNVGGAGGVGYARIRW